MPTQTDNLRKMVPHLVSVSTTGDNIQHYVPVGRSRCQMPVLVLEDLHCIRLKLQLQVTCIKNSPRRP